MIYFRNCCIEELNVTVADSMYLVLSTGIGTCTLHFRLKFVFGLREGVD